MLSLLVTLTVFAFMLSLFFFSKYTYIIDNIYHGDWAKRIIKRGKIISLIFMTVFFFCSLFHIVDNLTRTYFVPVTKIDTFDAFSSLDATKTFIQSVRLVEVPNANLFQLEFISQNGNFVFRAFLTQKDLENFYKQVDKVVIIEKEKQGVDAFLVVWKLLYCPCNAWSYKK